MGRFLSDFATDSVVRSDKNAFVTAAGDRSGARTPTEGRQVVGAMAPYHVVALPRIARGPSGRGPGRDGVDHLAHADLDALGGQRGDRLVGGAAGHDVVEEAHVRVDVEGEAVHRPATREAHADGRDLAGVLALGIDPDPGEAIEPAGAGQAQVGQRVDHHLLDAVDVRRGVGHASAPLARHRQDRIADELARPVEGDVSATVGAHQIGTDLGRRRQQVAEVGPHAERVDGRVLEQQQPVVGTIETRSRPGREQPLLQRMRVGVGHRAQPAHAQRGGHASSAAQSRVSRICLTSRRKAAA